MSKWAELGEGDLEKKKKKKKHCTQMYLPDFSLHIFSPLYHQTIPIFFKKKNTIWPNWLLISKPFFQNKNTQFTKILEIFSAKKTHPPIFNEIPEHMPQKASTCKYTTIWWITPSLMMQNLDLDTMRDCWLLSHFLKVLSHEKNKATRLLK